MSLATVFQNLLNLFNSSLIISIFGVALILLAILAAFDHQHGYGWLIKWGMIGGIAVSGAAIAQQIL